jgi:hypothetical protein
VGQSGFQPAANGLHSPETLRSSSAERPQSKVRGRRWWARKRLSAVALVGAASIMAMSVVLYVDGAANQRIPTHAVPASGGTTVTLNVVGIQNNYSELIGDLIVRPGPELLDPQTDGLKQDLTVAVTSVTTPVKRTWTKGMLPGVFPISLTLAHDVERWPFDT